MHVACVGPKIPEKKAEQRSLTICSAGGVITAFLNNIVGLKVMTALHELLVFLPFLVFEVLESQVYNFLDESVQKRMQGDLGRETKLTF